MCGRGRRRRGGSDAAVAGSGGWGVLHDRARLRGPGGRRGDRVPGEHHRRRRRRGLRGRWVAPRVRQVGRRGRPVPGLHFLRRRRGRGARRGGDRGGAGRRGGPRGGREAGAGDRRGHAQAASPCGLRRPAAAVRVRRRGRVRPRLGTPHLPRSPRRARRVLVRGRRGSRRGRQRVRDRHQGQQDLEGEPGRRAAPRHHERHLHPASRDGEQPHRRQRHRLPPKRLPPRHPHLRGRPLQGGPQDGGRERRQGAGLPEEGRRAGAALRDEAGRRRHADPARRELRRLGDRECHGQVRRAGAPGRVVGHGEGRGCVRQPHLRIRIRHEEDARHCESGVRSFVARPPGALLGTPAR